MNYPAHIKKISTNQLAIGMYVHDLDCGWLQHPFFRNRFLVSSESVIAKIVKAGITQLYIDTIRGIDVVDSKDIPFHVSVVDDGDTYSLQKLTTTVANIPKASTTKPPTPEKELEVAKPKTSKIVVPTPNTKIISIDEERRRAASLYRDATSLVQRAIEEAKDNNTLDLNRLEPVVEKIVDSVFRHSDALHPMAQLKNHDTYTYEHAVASAAMVAAFGRNYEMDREKINQIALGSLLQDIGMVRVPSEIIRKRSRLDPHEIAMVQAHVQHSLSIAQEVANLPELTAKVIAQHHERIDGSGYPLKLKGDQIEQAAQMASIVDVYDAMISQSPHQNPMTPTAALRTLFELSDNQFDKNLVQSFIRTVGVYPVGSLVRFESGVLGVVIEQTDDSLKPYVRIFYNTQTNNYFSPKRIRASSLGGRGHGGIVSHERFTTWNIDPIRWLPT